MTDMEKNEDLIDQLLRESMGPPHDEAFVKRVMDNMPGTNDSALGMVHYARFLPAALGVIGFLLSAWVFYDYSLIDFGFALLSTAPTVFETNGAAAWTLAAIFLGAGLWVFTELE